MRGKSDLNIKWSVLKHEPARKGNHDSRRCNLSLEEKLLIMKLLEGNLNTHQAILTSDR